MEQIVQKALIFILEINVTDVRFVENILRVEASLQNICLFTLEINHTSGVVRKPVFCICENKDADQLRGIRETDQRFCFHHTDSIIPLLPKSEILSVQPSSVVVQPGLCWTWSETPKTGFLATRLVQLGYLWKIFYTES